MATKSTLGSSPLPALAAGNPYSLLVYATILSVALIPLHAVWLAVFVGLIVGGSGAIALDGEVRRLFMTNRALALFGLAMLFILGWQVVGLIVRGDLRSGKSWQAAGNVLAVAMFGVVVVAAKLRDPRFTREFLAFGGYALAVSALVAILVQVGFGWSTFTRLSLFGRANNAIISAGALVFGVAAALLATQRPGETRRVLLLAAAAVNAAALALTFSRGPALAAAMAAVVAFIVTRFEDRRTRALVMVGAMLVAVAVPIGLILNEARVHQLVCTNTAELCRNSYRLELWKLAARAIGEHPWFGLGPTAEIDNPFGRHPHNGYMAPAFYFGIPVALAYLGLILVGLVATFRKKLDALASFCLFMIAFSLLYMVADLSDAFSFINSHYLFLWLPIFLAVAPEPRPSTGGRS